MDTSQRELELIRKVQRTNDVFAMKELLRLFRGTIQKCIREANLGFVMDEATAVAYAENIVRHALKENFDPSKKTKPNTFITNTLNNKLKTLKYERINMSSRMSTDLAMKAMYIHNAEPALKRMGIENPTDQQILDYIKKDLGKSPNLKKAEVKRIRSLEREELDGNRYISQNVEGSSKMSLTDTLNVQKISAQDMLERKFFENKVERVIGKPNYSANERKFIRMMYGIGIYKNNQAKNIHRAALDSGLTDASARRTLDKLKKELDV